MHHAKEPVFLKGEGWVENAYYLGYTMVAGKVMTYQYR
jgi:hypothetical protein